MNKALAVSGPIVSSVSATVGLLDMDGITAFVSVLSLCLSVIAVRYGSEHAAEYSFAASAAVLICTALAATVLSYETLVENGIITRSGWIYVSTGIRTVAVMPLILVFLMTSASISGASYNWVLVSGLSTFIGIGMTVPGYALMRVMQMRDFESGAISNANIVIGLMVSLVMFAALAVALRSVFLKNRYLITRNGIEVMP